MPGFLRLAIPGLFFHYVHLFYLTIGSKMFIYTMMGIEPWFSVVGGNHSVFDSIKPKFMYGLPPYFKTKEPLR